MNEIKSDKYAFLGLFCTVLVSLYIYSSQYTVLLVVEPQEFKHEPRNNLSLLARSFLDYRQSIDEGENNDDFCRVNDVLFNWKKIIGVCEGATTWASKRKLDIQAARFKSDARSSFVRYIDIQARGKPSKLVIQSAFPDGTWKTFGGDVWRVNVKGPSSPSVAIFDNENGTYDIIFTPIVAGFYKIFILLDYTLCNGLVDPPENWFIEGNAQGKQQRIGVTGPSNDFLHQVLGNGSPFETYIREDNLGPSGTTMTHKADLQTYAHAKPCEVICHFLWGSFGAWRDNDWVPLGGGDALDASMEEVTKDEKIKPSGRLLLYGDSVTIFLYHSLRRKTELCRQLFLACDSVYHWIYQVHNITRAKTEWDSLDINVTRILKELFYTLTNDVYNNEDSAIILNYGLHFVESTNFSNYKALIDGVVELLTRKTPSEEKLIRSTVIWKTTTAINKERASMPQLHHRRFLTSQRVQLFNAYANEAMCKAGIPVIDVYSISDAYPYGTGTHGGRVAVRNDVVHYHNEVFYPLETFLLQYFTRQKIYKARQSPLLDDVKHERKTNKMG